MTSTTIIARPRKARKPPTLDQVRAQGAAAGLAIARLTGDRTAKVPSATTPGVEYTVWIQDGGAWTTCTCQDGGAHCWHGRRALELYAAAHPAPAVVAAGNGEAGQAARRERGRKAVADLYGEEAA